MKIHFQGTDIKEALEPFGKLLKPNDTLIIRCEKGKVHLYGKNGGTWLDMEPCNLSSDSDGAFSMKKSDLVYNTKQDGYSSESNVIKLRTINQTTD